MEIIKEKELKNKPCAIPYECTEIILDQMKKNICKIKMKDGSQGTGFFCKIPFPNIDNLLPVLITNNHVINPELLLKENEKVSLAIKNDKKVKTINLNNRITYTNPDYDITILELKEEKDEIKNYLELDELILENILDSSNNNEDSNQIFIGETIYILQYPEGNLSVSYGLLDSIIENKKYNFNHSCSTKRGSSGSPILNISTNKILGIHKEGSEIFNFNRGTFLNKPIKEFIKQNYFSNNKINVMNNQNNQNIIGSKFVLDIKNLDDLFPLCSFQNSASYLNSTLQCLIHIPELNNFFIKVYPQQKDNFLSINKNIETKGIISKSYFDIVFSSCKNLLKNNYIELMKKNFCEKISLKNFEKNLKNLKLGLDDSKDFLSFMLQSLHDELNYYGYKKLEKYPKCNQLIVQESLNYFLTVHSELNLSIISYLFYGITEQETCCRACRNILYNFQFFQMVTFNLYDYKNKDQFNIYQGFKEFVSDKSMRGDNQCFCQKCMKLTDSDVSSKIYLTPPYLIIHLDYGKNNKYAPKQIIFGEFIDLTGFTLDECTKRNYNLIIVNSYSYSQKNFITFVKNPFNEKNSWFAFNDSIISETSFENVVKSKPVFLIYRRND